MYVDRRGPVKQKASEHSDPVWMQDSIFEARLKDGCILKIIFFKKGKKVKLLKE